MQHVNSAFLCYAASLEHSWLPRPTLGLHGRVPNYYLTHRASLSPAGASPSTADPASPALDQQQQLPLPPLPPPLPAVTLAAANSLPPPQQQQQQQQQQPGHAGPGRGSEWQVLFSEQRLDCQLSIEDMSPGMPWGRAKFQVGGLACLSLAGFVRRLHGLFVWFKFACFSQEASQRGLP